MAKTQAPEELKSHITSNIKRIAFDRAMQEVLDDKSEKNQQAIRRFIDTYKQEILSFVLNWKGDL